MRNRHSSAFLGGVGNVQFAHPPPPPPPQTKGGWKRACLRSTVQGLPPQWWRHDSRRCACMQAPVQIGALSHDWRESGLFSLAKTRMKKQLGTKQWLILWGSPLSSLLFSSLSFSFPLSLSFSISQSLFLVLSLSLSLSLSLPLFLSLPPPPPLSLSLGHTHKHCQVNAHP